MAPNVTQSPQSVTVVAGSDIMLECRAAGDPIPKASWLKDGRPASTVYPIVSKPGYSSLTINYTNTGDSGSYQCKFTNIKGSALSDVAIVTVNGKA